MTQEPPESPTSSIVQAILAVRDWRRAAILMVLGLVALFGAIVWQARERLVAGLTAFLAEPPKLVLADHAALEAAATALVNPLRPDYGVVVWSVNLEMNRRKLVVFAPGDVPLPADFKQEHVPGYIAPLFVRKPHANALLVAVLDGETACGETSTYQGKIEYACAAGIPPGPGPLLGLIAALYPHPLNDHEQGTTRSALQDAAEKLTVYR